MLNSGVPRTRAVIIILYILLVIPAYVLRKRIRMKYVYVSDRILRVIILYI
jgi:hypothetical protein